MQKRGIYLFTVIIAVALSIAWGKGSSSVFWKGNMHTHSFWSDGNTFPEEVAFWYKNHGYNFLLVTDHNILQSGEKWINVDRNERIRKTYDEYLEHFGGVGLETKNVEANLYVRLRTLDEYRGEFELSNRFLLLSGEEISDAAERKPVHLNGIDLHRLVDPAGGQTVKECLANNVKLINEAVTEEGHPDWLIVNHPNFGWALTAEDIEASGARFFEVFNGHPSVRNYGNAEKPGTEVMWDQINKMRLAKGEAMILGVANDDAHHYHEFSSRRANPGRGWNMVRSEDLSAGSLYDAMIRGDYYFSTGVELKDFVSSGKQLKIRIKAEKGVTYTVEFVGLVDGESQAKVLKTINGTKAKYRFAGDELFVRARIRSSKLKENPFAEGDYEMAWLQPVRPK